jgi:hypothetical protein
MVYDGTSVNGTLLDKFGGTTTPGVLNAKSGSVFVRFISDRATSGAGVGMRWSDIAPATIAPTSSPAITGGTPSPDEDARMLWRACIPTGVLVCAGFALGILGSMACPPNYFRIVAEDVCRSAAAAVGQAYQGRETSVVSPRGCNLFEYTQPQLTWRNGVFFNDATGAGPSQSKLLCSGARVHLYSRRGPSWVLARALLGYRGLR